MSKQLTKSNGIVEVKSKPLNNNTLIQQLKAVIIHQCFPMVLAKKQEGCLEFAVRGGDLVINYILDERDISPNTEVLESSKNKTSVGMKRTGLKTMIMMLESALNEYEYLDHGTVLVKYSVDDKGEYVSGKLSVKRGIHYPRY